MVDVYVIDIGMAADSRARSAVWRRADSAGKYCVENVFVSASHHNHEATEDLQSLLSLFFRHWSSLE